MTKLLSSIGIMNINSCSNSNCNCNSEDHYDGVKIKTVLMTKSHCNTMVILIKIIKSLMISQRTMLMIRIMLTMVMIIKTMKMIICLQ